MEVDVRSVPPPGNQIEKSIISRYRRLHPAVCGAVAEPRPARLSCRAVRLQCFHYVIQMIFQCQLQAVGWDLRAGCQQRADYPGVARPVSVEMRRAINSGVDGITAMLVGRIHAGSTSEEQVYHCGISGGGSIVE